MKISNLESLRASQTDAVSRPMGVTGASPIPSGASGQVGTPAAQVELSSQAQVLASAKAAVEAAPDTRDDLVAKLKAQIDGGTYQVSGKDIADQMLRRAQADRIH
jgi:negative regulator of flagellin synthesis FlgM